MLPDLGEGLPEAEIVQWHVAEGDTVSLNQTLAEVETAKAVVEIPSPFAGVVRTLHAAPGDVVDVGAVLVSVDTAAASGDAGGVSQPYVGESMGPNRSVRSNCRPSESATVTAQADRCCTHRTALGKRRRNG